jgi:hypothetical protein
MANAADWEDVLAASGKAAMAAGIGPPESGGGVAGGTAASGSRGSSRQSQPAAPRQHGTEMPSAASATAAGEASGEMVPSGGPPAVVPQHEVPPWVAATAKATPVPGMPAADKPRGEQPDAQAPQTPGDTISAAANRSVWVTRAARLRSENAPNADAARATIANTRSSLPSIVAGLRRPTAIPCRTDPGLPGRRPCQSVASSGEFVGAWLRKGKRWQAAPIVIRSRSDPQEPGFSETGYQSAWQTDCDPVTE